jgi:hypothetical protein
MIRSKKIYERSVYAHHKASQREQKHFFCMQKLADFYFINRCLCMRALFACMTFYSFKTEILRNFLCFSLDVGVHSYYIQKQNRELYFFFLLFLFNLLTLASCIWGLTYGWIFMIISRLYLKKCSLIHFAWQKIYI